MFSHRFARAAGFAAAASLLAALSPARADKSSWSLDPSRTEISFTIDAAGFPRTHGVFHAFKGRLDINLDRPGLSHVAFSVDANSIDVGSPSFNGVLRGAAFLDAERFPTIEFDSNSVEKLDGKTVRVGGEMTLLGVKLPLDVIVDVTRAEGEARLAFKAKARIDRLAWGMNSGYPVISRDVDLLVSSEAIAR